MAKNLVYRLSPVHVGISVRPNVPANPDSGDLCRLGSMFGVCLVDHKDKLAGGTRQVQDSTDKAMSTPVMDFTTNVWEFDIYSVAGDADGRLRAGHVVYFVEGQGVDTSSGYFLAFDKPGAAAAIAGVLSGTANETIDIRVCGYLMEDIVIPAGSITAGHSVRGKVMVGIATDDTPERVTLT